MRKPTMKPFLIAFLLSVVTAALPAQSPGSDWMQIDTGLHYLEVKAAQQSVVGDSKLRILRIDPSHYDFKLVTASENGGRTRTAEAWCRDKGLLAAVNAGMYRMDHRTNVGYMKNYDHVNNPKYNADNTLFACNPSRADLPPVRIIDRECEDWESLVADYQSVSQSIRMVDCEGQNKWSQQPKMWSTVAIGMDTQGRILFLFTRSPYSVHDFIDMLLKLKIGLRSTMYLEGGPEASFYLRTDDCELNYFGSYETGFYESDANDHAWPIPNVIGIVKKGH